MVQNRGLGLTVRPRPVSGPLEVIGLRRLPSQRAARLAALSTISKAQAEGAYRAATLVTTPPELLVFAQRVSARAITDLQNVEASTSRSKADIAGLLALAAPSV